MSWWRITQAEWSRSPLRFVLTAISLILAFTLFGLLEPVRQMFSDSAERGSDARIVVSPRHSMTDLLPVSHGQAITTNPAVVGVAHLTWFGGTYKDPSNFFPQFAVTPETFLGINPEIELPEAQANAFLTTRRGAIVGQTLAAKYNWQIGDHVTLTPNIWHNQEGLPWTFEIVGILNSSNEAFISNEAFYFSYAYFDEYRAFGNGTVGTFLVSIDHPDNIASAADAIDSGFSNSRHETRTQSAQQYALVFVKQMGEIGLIATAIMSAMLFTLALLTGHTMAYSVRERTADLAIMRVLGFKATTLGLSVVLLAIALCLFTSVIGLGFAHYISYQLNDLSPTLKQLGGLHVTSLTVVYGVALSILLGIGTTAIPVVKALRHNLSNALKVEV